MMQIILSFILMLLTTRFMHYSFFTIILMASVFFLAFNKKIFNRKVFLFYCFSFLYLIGSFINSKYFNSYVPGDFDFNFLKEILYIIKYSIPFLFFYIIKDINIDKKIINYLSVFIFLSLLITNVFLLSYSSYSDVLIKGNIFDWFSNSYEYHELASKGIFMYANQIALLMCIFSLYYIFKKNHLYLFINALSGLLLATRVSTFLPVMMLFVFGVYIFVCEVWKRKVNFKYHVLNVLIIIFLVLVVPISPQIRRIDEYDLVGNTVYADNYVVSTSNIKLDKVSFIENNYEMLEVNENFVLNSYPYKYDPDFWYDILKEPYEKRIDYRFLEISMVKRVYEVSDNKADYLFGIGMSRVFNIWNIESDIVMQFYSFGLFGLLLVMFVYFKLISESVVKFFKSRKVEDLYPMAMTVLFLLISYLSGNILNSLPITLIFIMTINCLKNTNFD